MDTVNPNGTKHHWNRGHVEGSWKGMKKTLEQDMLCASLKGRVSYYYAVYPKLGTSSGTFSISLDGAVLKKFGYRYATSQLMKQNRLDARQYIWDIPIQERDEYEDDEFSEALRLYRNQPIKESIMNKNPLVRMFAIVDRRVGKRTLACLRCTVQEQPAWLQPLYCARMEAEHIGSMQDVNLEKPL